MVKIKANIETNYILYEAIKNFAILNDCKIGSIVNIAFFEFLKDKNVLTPEEVTQLKEIIK